MKNDSLMNIFDDNKLSNASGGTPNSNSRKRSIMKEAAINQLATKK